MTVGGAALFLVLLAAAACVLERVAEARDRRRFPPPGRLVDIDGRRLHLACLGSASGPTVVIEQGAGSPSVTWWPRKRLPDDRAGRLLGVLEPAPVLLVCCSTADRIARSDRTCTRILAAYE